MSRRKLLRGFPFAASDQVRHRFRSFCRLPRTVPCAHDMLPRSAATSSLEVALAAHGPIRARSAARRTLCRARSPRARRPRPARPAGRAWSGGATRLGIGLDYARKRHARERVGEFWLSVARMEIGQMAQQAAPPARRGPSRIQRGGHTNTDERRGRALSGLIQCLIGSERKELMRRPPEWPVYVQADGGHKLQMRRGSE